MSKFFAHTLLFALIITAAGAVVFAQKLNNKQPQLWQQVNENTLQPRHANADGQFLNLSEKYRVFRLNRTLLNNILGTAPLENTESARENPVVLEIPLPDGTIQHFRIEESPMLAPEIAAQFPTWKQFSGQGIEDQTATARFDISVSGFHGYVLGANGTMLIDPYSQTDQKNYIVYYKGDVGDSQRESFSCPVNANRLDDAMRFLFAPQAFSNGTQLRNYRLAVSATKEYTNYFGGNRNTAYAAIVTTINRIITIYRRDLATTFTLVTGVAHVFSNARTGGFPAANNPNVANDSLTRNQVVMDSGNNGDPGPVGTANYDIGHVFSRTGNPNGLATSPSLCDPSTKAQGFTGAPVPEGDGYDVDYVAHEIGHQFAMSHTFNNDIDGSCSTREPDSAYEPASGVTIMGYGGICAPRNLAKNSIEFFNLRSFDQAFGWFQSISQGVNGTSPGCGNPTANGNSAPTVTSPGNFTIPRLTPFTLTATATDANGDALTYLWEEFDLGAATGSVPNPNVPNPNNTNPTRNNTDVDSDANGTIRPIFRAYNPTTSGARTFPSLYYILNPAGNSPAGSNQPTLTYTGTLPFAPTSGSTNGYVCETNETCVRGEQLPTISRTMNFRVTVRDNRAGTTGGGVADAQSTVTVAAGAGPFQITTQNTSAANLTESFAPEATWQAGTQQTVTWDVANTNAAPVNAANVNILLSTDGGLTFPITILANTLNDGTETITVPNNPTTTARIKIQPTDNIFFDINNANFTITAPTAASVSVAGRVLSSFGRGISNAIITSTDQNGIVQTARTNSFGYYRFNAMSAGQTYVLSVRHKQYTFAAQVISVSEDLSGFDFVAQD